MHKNARNRSYHLEDPHKISGPESFSENFIKANSKEEENLLDDGAPIS